MECNSIGQIYVPQNVFLVVKKLRLLENVAIANALQVEAARRLAVPPRFNFVEC